MDFYYEVLDDKKFQKLCQALIVAQYPNTQCFPVGQPDGGRDAVYFHSNSNQNEFTVFQVKFSRSPDNKTERDVIETFIRSESEKIKELIQRGATSYVLMTNVKGTAHPGSGSIDKATKALADLFNIPVQVWWRDDLDRRLENEESIKWSYPEILKATDVLPLLIQNSQNSEDTQATRAIKGYMTAQYNTDRNVKFKQVELQHSLTDLFVDLPLSRKRPQIERNRRDRFPVEGLSDIGAYIRQLDFDEDYEFESENPFAHSGLAAAFLLKMPLVEGVTRFVVEGAPGQGKSTATQFLCQVNRLRFLKKKFELASVDDLHKTVPIRVPFRVDLRDYANWVTNYNSSANAAASTPTQGNRSLESFLANQVESESGGLRITADELLQFFVRYHSVIVLDGFDEVADIETRECIVEEICVAAERWDTHVKPCAKSMQIIVTSRPAAFASSPGFPEDDWIYLQLEDLRGDNIKAYKDKWIKAQRLSEEDGDLVSSTLNNKLEQPHLRDLARNPMQLAILLHLIHVQGVALPEKRTTLYEEYMKLFFNREAEKSKVVRDHRELLLSIHGVLAWVLHTQAEGGAGSGSITRDALHRKVKTYLETEEHDPDLAEELLQGTVERVGALVSRIEGTFEFEVQPLREYFAALYLYKTAPYSPPGRTRKGTRPERFQAIARSLYWTNVTRFFCGFYDVGELDGLVEGLIELGQQDGHNLINRPRRLAMMLLSDQVFSQTPKTMKRLVAFVVEEPGFHRLASAVMTEFRGDMGLPAKAGGKELFEACEKKLTEEDNPSRRKILRAVMAANASREKLKSTWKSRFENGLMECKPLHEAKDFGIANQFAPEEIAKITNDDMYSRLRWLILSNHYKYIVENSELYKLAKKAFFDDELELLLPWRHSTDSVTVLEVLTNFLRSYHLATLYSEIETDITAHAVLGRRYGYFSANNRLFEQLKQQDREGVGDSLESFTLFVLDLLGRNVKDWQQKLDPWSELVDRGFDEAPANHLMLQIAIIATASRAERGSAIWNEDGFAATKGLVHRLFFARHKCGDVSWWRTELAKIKNETISQCLAILLSWGTPDLITALKTDIDSLIKELSSHNWSHLCSMANMASMARREYNIDFPENRVGISEDWFNAAGTLSSRMAFILINRVDDQETTCRLSRKYFASYDGNDAQILRGAFQTELFGPDEYIVDWDYVCRLSKHAHKIGVRAFFPHYYGPQPLRKVPEEVAKAVLSDSENHSRQLVVMCEQNYATKVEQLTAKVSQVAEVEGWDVFQDK